MLAFPLLVLMAACGELAPEPARFAINVTAEWQFSPASRDAVGYVFTVVVGQLPANGGCAALPPATQVLVNGVPVFLGPYDSTGCQAGASRILLD